MNPVAFSIAGIDIRWYGILIGTGIILGIIIANYNSKFRNVNVDTLLDFVLIGIPCGIIGARAYYVVFNFSMYKDDLKSIFYIREGGLAIHGGLIASIFAIYIYSRYKKISILKYLDVATPSIILAQAIGRWGNFFNGEAHGGEVSESFISRFPSFIQKGMNINGTYYHPTFLYESIWNIIVFIALIFLLRKSKKLGIVLFSYIGLYSLGRFFIEGLRTDSLYFGPIRTAQFVSCIGILLSIAYLVLLRTGKIRNYE